MTTLRRKRNRYRRRRQGIKIITIGVIVIAAFCLFAGVIWPKIRIQPEIAIKGGSEISVAWNQSYKDKGASAKLKDEDISDQIQTEDNVDTSKMGDYEVEYSVEYKNRTYTKKRMVHVVDKVKPTIKLKGDKNVVVENKNDFQEPGYTAEDDYDGDLTSAVTSSTEQKSDDKYIVKYTVKDAAGNEGTAERQITIKDDVPPEISLNGDKNVNVGEGDTFKDPSASASDNKDGDISANVKVSGYVDLYRPGTYTLTYSVKDSSNNVAKTTRTVTVQTQNTGKPGVVYLTFDDGPSSDVTVKILDTLKKNNIKATFFICDYEPDKLPILKRMIAEGHTIGIHGYSHDYPTIYKSTDAFIKNIETLRDKLKKDTGYEAYVIRFPGGSSNTISRHYCPGVMTKLVQEVTKKGWMYMDWNVDSTDAEGNNRPTSILTSNVKSELMKNRGNVVLMHDTSAKQTTAQALPSIISYAKKNGYTFEAIAKDTVPVHHGVNN